MTVKTAITLLLGFILFITLSVTGGECAETGYYPRIKSGLEREDFNMLSSVCREWQEDEPENSVPVYLSAYIYYLNYYPDEGWNAILKASEMDFNAEELIPFARKLKEDLPDNPYVMMILGEALSRNGEFEEAIPLLENASELQPGSAMPHHVLGYIYFALEDGNNAEKQFLEGIEADPEFLPNYMMLGKFYKWAERKNVAEKIYEEGLRKSRKHKRTANFHLKLAWLYAEDGDYDKAVKMIRDGLKIKPDNPGLMLSLGDIYLESGDLDKAEEIFEGNTRFVPERGGLYREALNARLKRIESERKEKEKEKGRIRYD